MQSYAQDSTMKLKLAQEMRSDYGTQVYKIKHT